MVPPGSLGSDAGAVYQYQPVDPVRVLGCQCDGYSASEGVPDEVSLGALNDVHEDANPFGIIEDSPVSSGLFALTETGKIQSISGMSAG